MGQKRVLNIDTMLKLPTKKGWVVGYIDRNGKTHYTDFYFKSRYHAQRKADELMFENQMKYFITKCLY